MGGGASFWYLLLLLLNLNSTHEDKEISGDEDLIFFPSDPDPAQLKKKKSDPAPTLIRNEKKNIYVFWWKKIIYIKVTAVHQ